MSQTSKSVSSSIDRDPAMASLLRLNKVDDRWTIVLTVTVFLLSFILYVRAAAPSVATIFDDSLEFPLVVHRLAIAHPTGYPLYILLGKLFSLFNPTNVAYQLNLMSAFFGALTVATLYRVGLAFGIQLWRNHLLSPGFHAGMILTALNFGLGPIFVSQATIAEVYTLNAFFFGLILWLALQRRWLWLAFVIGLSLTHHRTTLLLLPGIGVWAGSLAWKSSRETGEPVDFSSWLKTGGKLLLIGVLPLLLYLYLPLRGHVGSLDGNYQPTWGGFWQYVSGGGYGTFLVDNPFGNNRTPGFYFSLIVTEVGWWGVGLAGTGMGWLILQRRWRLLLFTTLTGLTYLLFNLFYSVTDIEVFFIPFFFLLNLLAGLALAVFFDYLWQKQALLAVFAVVIGLGLLFGRSQQIPSRADDWAVHDYGRDLLSQPIPENSAVVGILGEMTLMRYFQEVMSLRPDVATYSADLETERLSQVEALLADHPDRAVYLTRELPGVAERWSLSAIGPLIQVQPKPITQAPAVSQEIDIEFSPEVELVGYEISRPPSHNPSPPIRLTLLWHVREPISKELKFSVRLVGSDGNIAAVVDQVPVHFAYPTTAWRSGEYITDVYDLTVEANAPPGPYTPLIILYDPANNAAEVGRGELPPFESGF